jgi:transposase
LVLVPETPPLPSYAELVALVGELRGELAATRSELAAARAEIAELRAENAELRAENAELRAENAELKRRLGMNSKNSSKPPSSDGLAKPTSLRKPSGRGPGKPRGGALLQVAKPDAVEVHAPTACRGCAGDLTGAEVVSVERRQVFDLPEIRLRVTEHRVEHRRCACGQVTAATPSEAPAAPAQYGPRLKGLAVYLLTRQHLPYERCTELLADVLGAEIATATLHTWFGQAAVAVAPHTEAVRLQLIECEVVGFDETGTGIAGRTCGTCPGAPPSPPPRTAPPPASLLRADPEPTPRSRPPSSQALPGPEPKSPAVHPTGTAPVQGQTARGSGSRPNCCSCSARAASSRVRQEATVGRRRSSARRSRSVIPPQMPCSTRLSSASARHSVRTGQPPQTAFARFCAAPSTNNDSGSSWRHAADAPQSASSLIIS